MSNEKEQKLTLKNADLEAISSSDGLGNLKQNKDLPVTFSFRLADLMGKLQPTIRAYVGQKTKLIRKYGDKDGKNKLIQNEAGLYLFTKKAKWFQKEFSELLDLEFTIASEKAQISINDLQVKQPITCPHCKKEIIDQLQGIISADDINALKSIIDFKEE